ncbi:ALBINO3-like protein 2, chloroplastic isoform X3 [Tasmannia lanceolata]|uniref:ALBINO3-like protein 2, chloroplastic isoform X3 n=1 Tax=Tasmannia lanceolata TaxID=3420 RepID=UPI0040628946
MGRQLLLYHNLRRLRPFSTCISFGTFSNPNLNPNVHSITNSYHNLRSGGRNYFPSETNFLAFSNCNTFRSFSWYASSRNTENNNGNQIESPETDSELLNLGFDGLESVEEGLGEYGWYSPVRAVIILLDGYHDLTGLPWWAIIVSSTFALRMTLLPVLILQLKKLGKMSELMPKLPPPFPPPFSGRSFREQFMLFRKERRAIGCPSNLWLFVPFCIQVPCFILWMASIRRMSLDHHPGFDFVSQRTCPIFPILIACLHFMNVQISFRNTSLGSFPGVIGLLARYYKLYLDVLTIPIFLIGFCVPQGSLVYWLTNSSLNVVQVCSHTLAYMLQVKTSMQLSLKHPYILKQLGLPARNVPQEHKMSTENLLPAKPLHPLSLKHPYNLQKLGLPATSLPLEHKAPTENLPPDELLAVALQHLDMGHQDEALPLLRLASEKDPEMDKALIALGLFLLSKGSAMEATEYFERAISKIKDEEVSHLVMALYGAGVSLVSQGRNSEGIQHLRRIAQLKEPEDPKDKVCYFSGLIMLASTLFNDGQKTEALKYLRIAAAYDPAVNKYIEECEREVD